MGIAARAGATGRWLARAQGVAARGAAAKGDARRAQARQWLALLLPWYAAEGIVRAWSETGRHAAVAAMAALVAIATCACVLAWLRRPSG